MIRHAIKSGHTIRFNYDPPHTGISSKEITPYGIIFYQFYYIIGSTKNKETPSVWRLDRFSDIQITDTINSPPPDFDLKKYYAQSFAVFHEDPMEIELIFSKNSSKEAKKFIFHSSQLVYELPDGRLKIKMTCGGEIEICWHLFRWGGDVEIIKPKRLRNKMLQLLSSAHSVYSR